MKHLWRNAWLLLAALLLLFTVALAADGGDNPIGLRILMEKENISVTFIPPDSDETITYQEMCNIGTMTWDHVEGAKAYAITITKVGGRTVEHTISQNIVSLNDVIWGSGSYQLRVAALDAQDVEITEKAAAITWTYTVPERLPTPSITVEGAIGTVSCSSSLVDYYTIEFYQNGAFLGNTTTEPEEPRFSMPQWVYEKVQGDGTVTCCAVACTGNMLEASDSLKSTLVEIALPQEMPPVEGIRILTREETHEYEDWSGEKRSITLGPGCVVWNERDKDSHYDFAYYRVGQDGEPVPIYETGLGMPYFDLETRDMILTSGTYYAMARETTYELGYVASAWQQTDTWTYTQAAPLDTPTNLRWEGTVMYCDPVEGADEYAFRVYYRASSEEEFQWVSVTNTNTSPGSDAGYIMDEWGNGEYRFIVSAVSNNIVEAISSPYSEMGPSLLRSAQPLSPPTGFRIVTQEETITYEFEGNSYTDTLYPGYLTWDWDPNATYYSLEVYQEGVSYPTCGYSERQGPFCDLFQSGRELQEGTYTIQLKAADIMGTYAASDPVTLTYDYHPEGRLSTPAITASVTEDANIMISISPVEGETERIAEYCLVLHVVSEYGDQDFTYYTDQPSFILPENTMSFYHDGTFTITVQALSNNQFAYRNSAVSEPYPIELPALSEPENLTWVSEASGQIPVGAIQYTEGAVTQGMYQVDVYQANGTLVSTYSYDTRYDEENVIFCADHLFDFPEPGAYYFTVTSIASDLTIYTSSEPVRSQLWYYNPYIKYGTVSTAAWLGDLATWEYPDGAFQADGLWLEVWSGETPDQLNTRVYGTLINSILEDRVMIPTNSWEFPTDVIYTAFRVRLVSSDLSAAAHGDWVWSDVKQISETGANTARIIDDLRGNTLDAILSSLQQLSVEEKLAAWDTAPEAMMRSVKSLEEKANVTINIEEIGVVTSDVRVVGLGLSADDTTRDITLTVTRTPHAGLQLLAAPEISGVNFQSAADVTFKAENVKDELVIPVQISLPVSTEDPDQLRLYQGEDLEEVPFILAMENGQTFVKFAVSDLDQTYVLAEANPLGEVTVDDNGTVTVTANAPDGTTLYAVSYDESGKMLDVATASVTADETSYTLSLAPGAAVRVFLLDQNQTPLCQAKTLS